jgi:hypothetical protein
VALCLRREQALSSRYAGRKIVEIDILATCASVSLTCRSSTTDAQRWDSVNPLCVVANS